MVRIKGLRGFFRVVTASLGLMLVVYQYTSNGESTVRARVRFIGITFIEVYIWLRLNSLHPNRCTPSVLFSGQEIA